MSDSPPKAGRFRKVAGLDYRQGAVDYPEQLDEDARHHLLTKPFYDLDLRRRRFEGPGIDEDTRRHFCDFANMAAQLALPLEARILDLGCGPGWLVEYFARFGYDVTGIDISPGLVAAAQQRLAAVPFDLGRNGPLRCRVAVHDVESGPLPERFDLIIAYDSLHHFEDERAVMRNVSAMLSDGGLFLVIEGERPHEDSDTGHELAYVMQEYATLESPFDRDYLLGLLDEHGFLLVGDYVPVDGWFDRSQLAQAVTPPPAHYHYLLGKKVAAGRASAVPVSTAPANVRAAFSLLTPPPAQIAPGAPLLLEFEVQNTGDTVWLAGRAAEAGTVRFGLKILDASGQLVEEVHGLPPLGGAMAPGERRRFFLRHRAPAGAAAYTLKLDLIVQQLFWFEQQGTQPLAVRFEVGKSAPDAA